MYELIQHQKLSSTAATISFSSIPSTYTDLYIVVSSRSAGVNPEDLYIQFNGDTGANYSFRRLYGSGSSVASDAIASNATAGRVGRVNSGNYTGSTFSSTGIYITNYFSSVAKTIYSDTVEENNATQAFQMIFATLWSGTSPVSSVQLKILSGANFAQHTSATLYGVNRTSGIGAPKAVGGNITYSNGYWVHTFTGSGTFYAQEDLEVDALVVAGGGGGGRGEGNTGGDGAGGGGAGGYRMLSQQISTGSYSVLVGSGGTGSSSSTARGVNGSDSAFLSLIATGGGGGGTDGTGVLTGSSGGSGGGAAANFGSGSQSGGSPVSGQGFAGGSTNNTSQAVNNRGGAGGGGGGAAGSNQADNSGGAGGIGIFWNGGYYAGGGGGGSAGQDRTEATGGTGGLGGGGTGGNKNVAVATNGTANTGGGGGGGSGASGVGFVNGAAGGSGIVIVRYRA